VWEGVDRVGFLAPIYEYIDSLVHPSARCDPLTAARHRAFMAPRLTGGAVALAAFPVLLAFRGAPTPLEALVFGWLVLPLLVAYELSRTGRFERAHVLSCLAVTGLISVLAIQTGGISSFATPWLVIVPIEAALSASRRIVLTASMVSIGAACLLIVGAPIIPISRMPESSSAIIYGLAAISAVLYAAGLALGATRLARFGLHLLRAQGAHYQLLADHMSDVITRHGRNGTVRFVSPNGEALFGVPTQFLRGHGICNRIIAADRPIYLEALADAAMLGQTRSVELRVRRQRHTAAGPTPSWIWVEMVCRPLEHADEASPNDSTRQVAAVLRDVTERKLQQQVIDDAGLDIGLPAGLSNEWRTALGAIIGFSEKLAQPQCAEGDPLGRRAYAQRINKCGHEMLAVLNSMLAASEPSASATRNTPAPFRLYPLIDQCCELLALRARESGIDLVIHSADVNPVIVGDEPAVKKILLDLLDHGIRSTQPGGQVTVSVTVEGDQVAMTAAIGRPAAVGDDDAGEPDPHVFRDGEPVNGGIEARICLSRLKGLLERQGGGMEIFDGLCEGRHVTARLPVNAESVWRADSDERVEKSRRGKSAGEKSKIDAVSRLPIEPETSVIRVKKRA